MSDEELGKMVSFSFQFLAKFLPFYLLFPPPIYGDGDPILLKLFVVCEWKSTLSSSN